MKKYLRGSSFFMSSFLQVTHSKAVIVKLLFVFSFNLRANIEMLTSYFASLEY